MTTDYPRNLRAAIDAHQIRKSELDALISSGPTVCAEHGRPYADGALWHGCRVCAECMREEAAALRALRSKNSAVTISQNRLISTDASRFSFMATRCLRDFQLSGFHTWLDAYRYWRARAKEAAHAH